MTSTGPGPGWYPDPAGSGGQRYFDGTAWTEHWVPPAAPLVAPPSAPYGIAPSPAPPYPGYGAYPGYGTWAPPWKGAQLGRPPSGSGALAEPGQRLGARLLDALLMFGVFVVLSGITLAIVAPHVGPVFPDTNSDNGNGPTPGFVWLYLCVIACAFVTGLISIAYETFSTTRYGRTLGKRWMHIRPLRMDGSRLSGWRALGRSATRAGFGLLSWIGLLDPLWCLWDDKRQCLHDKVVDTIVINDPAPGESPFTGAHIGAPGVAPGYWPSYGYVPGSPVSKTNPLAIASLACSGAGFIFFGVPGIVGVILGFVSRAQIRRSNGWQNGSGIALSGIILGFVVMAIFTLIIVLPVVLSTSSTNSPFLAR